MKSRTSHELPEGGADELTETVADNPHWPAVSPFRIVDESFQAFVSVAPATSTALPSFGDRYRIERELGRGGMATVYLCTDTKFDRKVAIKLLHPDLAAAVGSERFHREIKIATGLTHPNILPAHDSGEAAGSLYYVMPFVEGESLRERLNRERQLPVQDAVRITCEVAGALQYAHTHGIVHRDIKPENILLESQHAVLADFGIARAITGVAEVEALTQTGMSLGTPTYMSPEQAMGEKHIDGRSDQYSLACVLYEMLAGYPPFMANTMQALVAKHLGEQVALLTTVRPAVPDELEDVVLRALEKVPADRFASMQEFADALSNVIATTGTWARRTTGTRLAPVRTTRSNRAAPAAPKPRRWLSVAGAVVAMAVIGLGYGAWHLRQKKASIGDLDPKRVAVLYFEDLSRDKSLSHAADGLTEGLIRELSSVRALKVVSSRGVAPFRNADLPRDSIARALQVGSLIVGSIEPTGSRVRLTARLVEGSSGSDVKRASFELRPDQLLAGLDSLVREVARLLRNRIGEEVRLQEQRASTSNVEAWTLEQRAERLRKEADSLSKTGDQKAAGAALAHADSTLASAEAADPAWIEPIIVRGWVALRRSQLERALAAVPWIDEGSGHAERALKRAPNDPQALALRGTLRWRLWTLRVTPDRAAQDSLLQRARRDLESAVNTDPSLARANITLSSLYYAVDDVPGALLAARRAYEEDAYLEQADGALARLFWGSVDLEQFNEARRWCGEGARRFPRDFRFAHCQLWLLVTPAVPADPDRAWRLLALLDSVTPTPQRAFVMAQGRILVGGALARAGQLDSARRVLRTARQNVTNEIDAEQTLLSNEAYVRILTGEKDMAIDLLKQYVAANPGHDFAEKAGTVWWWRDLRTHPRWREVSQPTR